jgi:hypothetical protein
MAFSAARSHRIQALRGCKRPLEKVTLRVGRRLLAVTLILSAFPALALTDQDKRTAIKAAPLRAFEECASQLKKPLSIEIEPMTLNGDEFEEVMISASHRDGGGGCLGTTGTTKILMIKDAAGKWQANLGVDADTINILPDKSHGFPDLELGGPGYCHPVWRWNGSEYSVSKKCVNGQLVAAERAASASTNAPKPSSKPTRIEDLLVWGEDLIYLHNGSVMHVNMRAGEIRYYEPKPSLAGAVQPSTVLFRGEFRNAPGLEMRGTVSGTAYVFKQGCDPAPYAVSGTYTVNEIKMSGQTPRRAANSCEVLATIGKSPHATLKFETPSDF